jgi:WXG100 family type VII secretion target
VATNPNVTTDEAGMAAAGQECSARAQEFIGNLRSINGEMATLQASWKGAASTTFNQAMDNWEAAFQKVINELIVMAEKLNVNMQGYRQTEDEASSVAQSFASALPGV